MKLVLFTANYPFGRGEEFLENEVRVAEPRFDEIVFVSLAKSGSPVTKYVPRNGRVVCVRDYNSEWLRRVTALRGIFRPRVWREVFRLHRERKEARILNVLSSVLLAEDAMYYLHKKRAAWESPPDAPALYVSYWLDASATYLAMHRQDLHGLCVSRAHGWDCFYDRGIVPYREIQLTALDGIYPISDAGRQDLLAHYGRQIPGLSEKVRVHHLGVRREGGAEGERYPRQMRTIVSCSSIIPLKRLDLLIGALSQCATPIHWVHYGDGPLKEQVLDEAREKLDPLPHITYEFRGNVPNSEVLRFYAVAPVDLFVNCSDSEGIPVSIMEAMARGIPVVARDVGGNGEIVDSACGRLLPAQTGPTDLARAIDGLLALPAEQFAGIRRAAAEKIAAQYDAESNYKHFYEQLEAQLFSISRMREDAPKPQVNERKERE
ncbi:glycosyltransferase [Pseudoflavonifractor phocaeensis]|uniref:glycosyltransferase n=1 Tax=Pseudoflavonifractor phocaeensis TaxID=1870988 RepID=UPI001F480024|nr:glycosyltransferase [Pseudoflavonifractor phocaeensis]MCF2595531.1 glycosyltransferase [Pseudoflavonifractor phocaeensis]